MKKAEVASRRMLEKMMDKIKQTLHKEFAVILNQFNKTKSQLFKAEFDLKHCHKIIEEQELAIVDMKLTKFYSKYYSENFRLILCDIAQITPLTQKQLKELDELLSYKEQFEDDQHDKSFDNVGTLLAPKSK